MRWPLARSVESKPEARIAKKRRILKSSQDVVGEQ